MPPAAKNSPPAAQKKILLFIKTQVNKYLQNKKSLFLREKGFFCALMRENMPRFPSEKGFFGVISAARLRKNPPTFAEFST